MRYDKKVTFVDSNENEYDPKVGDFVEPNEDSASIYANVSSMASSRQQATYGDVKNTRYVIRLLRPINFKFSYIVIDDERYYLDANATFNKATLTVVKNG